MEVLSFKISGKLAHFRKYFANNTAFSFTIPPRTSIMGMLAAIMGIQRDTYYESFASENIRIGVRVLTPLKKSFHRLNFLSIKTLGDLSKDFSSDFRGEGGRIQTPFELISGWDISKNEVTYQIFISHTEIGKEIFDSIKRHLLSKHSIFNVTLGIANFSAYLYDIELAEAECLVDYDFNEYYLIYSAIPTNHLEELKFDKEEFDRYNFVEEDLMPGDFKSDSNREVRKMNRLIFSTSINPLKVKTNIPPYKIKLSDEDILIQFMDS